jgi:hypothetical protein
MSYGDYLVEIALIPVWLGHMLATILGVLAVVLQARQVLMQLHHKQQQQLISNPVPASALSPLSLNLQAIVFAVLAISWPWRLVGGGEETNPQADSPKWYSIECFSGWLVVNHFCFCSWANCSSLLALVECIWGTFLGGACVPFLTASVAEASEESEAFMMTDSA